MPQTIAAASHGRVTPGMSDKVPRAEPFALRCCSHISSSGSTIHDVSALANVFLLFYDAQRPACAGQLTSHGCFGRRLLRLRRFDPL